MKMNRIAAAIPGLIETCRQLERDLVPEAVQVETEQGDQRQPHWSLTLAGMKEALGVSYLEDRQLAALSLSLAFGPIPTSVLPAEDAGALVRLLWPTGNQQGAWYSWGALADRLQDLLDAHRNQGG